MQFILHCLFFCLSEAVFPAADIGLFKTVLADTERILLYLLLREPRISLFAVAVGDYVEADRRDKALSEKIYLFAFFVFCNIDHHYNVAVVTDEIADFKLVCGNDR